MTLKSVVRITEGGEERNLKIFPFSTKVFNFERSSYCAGSNSDKIIERILFVLQQYQDFLCNLSSATEILDYRDTIIES